MRNIDSSNYLSREKFYEYMDIDQSFNGLDKDSQYLLLYEKLLTFDFLFNNPILLSSGKYELSNRQLATKQNMENYMKEKEVVSAYTELLDYFEDYKADHGDQINIKELLEIKDDINNLQLLLGDLINNKLISFIEDSEEKDGIIEKYVYGNNMRIYLPYGFKEVLNNFNTKKYQSGEDVLTIQELDEKRDKISELYPNLNPIDKTEGRDGSLLLYQMGKNGNDDILIIYNLCKNPVLLTYEGNRYKDFLLEVVLKSIVKIASLTDLAEVNTNRAKIQNEDFLERIDAEIKKLEDEESKKDEEKNKQPENKELDFLQRLDNHIKELEEQAKKEKEEQPQKTNNDFIQRIDAEIKRLEDEVEKDKKR